MSSVVLLASRMIMSNQARYSRFGTQLARTDGLARTHAVRRGAVGNCHEPSNVKAGGGACPIRWQCPACSHYNPDPSHPPGIEDQARALKASLETARAIRAAPYTIATLGRSPTTRRSSPP